MRTYDVGGRAVPALGLGCMGMTWSYGQHERDDERSLEVVRAALDLGVTHLDTADMYGEGSNEALVGRAVAGRRDEAFLATKVGLVVDEAATFTIHRDGSPEHIRAGIDASLARLGTDHVDLWYLHRADPAIPLEETWGAMAEAVGAGKVRALGLSEVSIAEAERAHAIHPVSAIQSELSVWTRDALGVPPRLREVEDTGSREYQGGGAPPEDVVGWCRDHGAAFVAFSPLGRGYLTGTVESVRPGDFRAGNPRFQPAALAANREIVDRVRSVAERHGATPAQVALAWVLAQGPHVLAVPGTKKLAYLRENTAAADLVLDADDLAALDELPPVAGARY
ncbi:MAG: aldo/keto reductase [Candidatus Nanopelagicales bacterium]